MIRITQLGLFASLPLLFIFACSGDSTDGNGDGDGPANSGSGGGNGGGHGNGTGGQTVDFDPDEVPHADTVRDETGISILDPSHPFHDRLATISLSEPFSDQGGAGEQGTFRIICGFSHASYDDPIVYPGMPGAAHLHIFLGNHTADAHSTSESLLANGETTCQGSELNRSSYWAPMLLTPQWDNGSPVFEDNGMRAYDPVLPVDLEEEFTGPVVYYKRASVGRVFPLPDGLRMIVGSAAATSPQQSTPVRFSCESDVHAGIQNYTKSVTVCEVGDILNMEAFFPICWDGVNLDVPDHKSHMSQKVRAADGSNEFVCPTTHPVPLPEVSYHFKYPVTEANGGPTGSTRGWRLSSDTYDVPDDGDIGGYSLHSDWFMAWNPEAMALFTEYCINQGRHCANGNLGNGYRLSRMVRGTATVPPVVNLGHGTHSH